MNEIEKRMRQALEESGVSAGTIDELMAVLFRTAAPNGGEVMESLRLLAIEYSIDLHRVITGQTLS